MSNIIRATRRPMTDIYTRWTGSNLSELNTHWGVSFSVTGSGALDVTALGTTPSEIPVGDWFNSEGYIFQNTTIEENLQEVPEGVLAFVLDAEE